MTQDEFIQWLRDHNYTLGWDGDARGRGTTDARNWWTNWYQHPRWWIRLPSKHQGGYSMHRADTRDTLRKAKIFYSFEEFLAHFVAEIISQQ